MTEAPTPTADQAEQEFATVVLTLDHTTAPREDGSLLQKFVCSTQDLTSSMLGLFSYYEEEHLLHAKSTIELFQQAAFSAMPAFVYRTRENVQIVLAASTMTAVIASQDGSVLKASAMIADIAGRVLTDALETQTEAPVLLLLAFDAAPVEEAPTPRAKRTRR